MSAIIRLELMIRIGISDLKKECERCLHHVKSKIQLCKLDTLTFLKRPESLNFR